MATPNVDRTIRKLYSAAQRFAQQAAADLARDRPDDSMAHAGLALENLVKAYLIAQHPLLVVASPSGQLDLAGMRWAMRNEPKPAAGSRTIQASEAVRRCCHLLPGLDESSLRSVLNARNGILHIGQTDEDAGLVVGAVAQAADAICPELTQDARGLWGHYYDAVKGRLDERRDDVAHRVADRLAQTREDWEVTFKRHGVDGVNALRSVADKYRYADDEQEVDCPACRSKAILQGRLEIEEVPEVDHDGPEHWVSGVSLVPYFEPDAFNCKACGFRLDGVEELEAADLPAERFELDVVVDPREYYGEDL